MAVKNLKGRPIRTWLTIMGIIIGVFLVITLLSLSEGLKDTVMQQLRMMGGEIIMIMPGDPQDMITTFIGGLQLSEADLEAISRASGVKRVLPMAYAAEIVRYEDMSKPVLLFGLPFGQDLDIYKSDLGWDIVEGKWPAFGRREVLVGNLIPKDIFSKLQSSDKIVIKGRPFFVSGVLRSMGSKQDDSVIALDLTDFRAITGKREGAQTAMAKIESGYDAEKVAENIRQELEKTAKRKSGDSLSFTVFTSEKASDMVGNVMGVVQLAVIAFASIAVMVGGIGIMNTMYTSVYERTKEIGILKAIGAKKKTIVTMFLVEAGVIGMFGGIIGIILGIIFAKGIELLVPQAHPVFYIKASISPFLIIFGLLFSFGVGCLSGYFPSKKAASLKPVEALRYE